jgi:hypothetical protein
MRGLVDELVCLTGLEPAAASAALGIAAEALAVRLDAAARKALWAVLPASVGAPPPVLAGAGHAEELYCRTAHQLGLGLLQAIETAQIACQSIHARLDAEARARLLRQLHPTLAELLGRSRSLDAAPADPTHHLPGTGHTLATGRPASRHPVSESRPPRTPRRSQ